MSISAHYISDDRGWPASQWTVEHVAGIAQGPLPEAPFISAQDVVSVVPDQDLWDLWPLQNADGTVAKIEGGELWMVLSAPRLPDPGLRHDIARTRLLFRKGGEWMDCGLLFPDDLNPGTREWSGSARFNVETGQVTAYFTAAGRRSDPTPSFEQRLFQTTGQLDLSGNRPSITSWTVADPIVVNDGSLYVDVAVDQGVPGNIKGFRDPYWFCDPADGNAYILFTGSQPDSQSNHNGVVGLAVAHSAMGENGFRLLPPIITADGLCNEMERPHLVLKDGLYYLFWSSQNSVFAPDGPKGPSGLYGMVAPSLTGPYTPLNGTGLVIANPAAEPRQAYCWQVLDTLEVYSFVDHWGLEGRDIFAEPRLQRDQFGGTIAPVLKIAIYGNTTQLLGLA
ncbi:MAG: glycoside hydrolase 68 family protein [Sphingopyxis sp.]|nr:glycoside hydrolase 68 family protein [Sphingopyxis sp.]